MAEIADFSARLEWVTAQVDDLVFSRGRHELNDLERKARLIELEAQVESIARKSSSALERVQELESSVSQLRLQSVESRSYTLDETTHDDVAPAAQPPPPPLPASGPRYPQVRAQIAKSREESRDEPKDADDAFTESTWDAVLFVGLPEMGPACSAWTVLLLLASVGLQIVGTTCVILVRLLTQERICACANVLLLISTRTYAHRQATLSMQVACTLAFVRPRARSHAHDRSHDRSCTQLRKKALTDPEIGEHHPVAFRKWRVDIAHSVTHYDHISRESLAARVCEGT